MAKFKVGDKVEILDGSKIKNYTGGFASAMYECIGEIMEIAGINTQYKDRTAYKLKESMYIWDERGLKLVTDNDKKIVITTDGKTTTAKLYDDKNIIKTAKAKCCPTDKFDFNTGALIAFGRLTDSELKFEEGLDWKAFKSGKIAVKVTKDNFKVFVAMAKMQGLRFKPDTDFNPFEDIADMFFRVTLPITLKRDELYIKYKDDSLKAAYDCDDMEEFIWE